MRTFRVIRDEDTTGTGHTGPVGEGAEWSDGTVMVRWTAGPHRAPSMFATADAARTELDRDGGRIEYDDEAPTTGKHGAKA